MSKQRIELLDSFRCIAVLGVLLFHYTERWVGLYPYGGSFRHIFSFGYLGVNFFFMISGFVISYTLEDTADLFSFFRNRFSRLFPPMLLCTAITILVVSLLDDHLLFQNAHKLKDILPSLTFISPALWTLLTKIHFAWISGSYWSLWTEVQFYIIASAAYFLNRKQFFRNLLLTGIVINTLKFIPLYLLHAHWASIPFHNCTDLLLGWKYGSEIFNISFFILWFLAGSIFYQLYKGFRLDQDHLSLACAIVVLFFILAEARIFNVGAFYGSISAILIMFSLFLLLIYREEYLSFLRNPLFRRIGVISYSIYLIHEDIGVLLINKYGGLPGDLSLLTPFIVIILMACFAETSYRLYEKKVTQFLRKVS